MAHQLHQLQLWQEEFCQYQVVQPTERKENIKEKQPNNNKSIQRYYTALLSVHWKNLHLASKSCEYPISDTAHFLQYEGASFKYLEPDPHLNNYKKGL